ncbi:MAG: queuosine precursor transporter, partial [Cytophagales bacterium]
ATIAISYPFAIISSIGVLLIEGSSVYEALRIGFASASAYGISTLLDVYIFQVIREKYKYWWLAPSVSTVFANIIDTFVFFYTAFYNSTDEYMKENWVEIALNQSIIKITIGLILFLPIYGIFLNYILYKLKND